MRKISESTVRRLALYLRYLEQFEGQGLATISSQELAKRGGTTSAQVRKDQRGYGVRVGAAVHVVELALVQAVRLWGVLALVFLDEFRDRAAEQPDQVGRTR